MTCCYCGGDMVEATTTYFQEHENTIVIVKKVPCHKCKQCGEVAYTATVVGRLEQITARFENAFVEFIVVNYSAA